MASLKDTDVSIRRRALDLLFTMCNRNNAREIIHELLEYLEIADFSLREELVLKTAVLAERFTLPFTHHQGCFESRFDRHDGHMNL